MNMIPALVLIGFIYSYTQAQVPCPVPWWYCLNRNSNDNSQVNVVDTSNRSAKWNWNAGDGRWDVSYQHSFPTGDYSVYACYTRIVDNVQSYVSYQRGGNWKSNAMPISTSAWDMAYNGDIFGFKPRENGQYIFHIYTRKLEHNPFAGTSPNEPNPTKRCPPNPDETLKGSFWVLERKSINKCPVSVNRADFATPYEWSWETDNGKWFISYTWSDYTGTTNSTVFYSRNGVVSQNVKLLSWQFDTNLLTLSYDAAPLKVYEETAWKMKVNGKETFGYTPIADGQWIFPIFSRNVVIRPFEKATGVFNLQQQYYDRPFS